jgi:hypothetical protein
MLGCLKECDGRKK